MKKASHSPGQREFHHNNPYNMFLVDVGNDGVIVRAALDNFTEQQKCHFIRQLAAEGFIPDEYEWLCSASLPAAGLKWEIDRSWLAATPALMGRKATPWVLGMFATALLILIVLLSAAVMLHQ